MKEWDFSLVSWLGSSFLSPFSFPKQTKETQNNLFIIKKMHYCPTLDIPHVVLMTKIDLLCPMVKTDLSKVYKSRKIKEKVGRYIYIFFFKGFFCHFSYFLCVLGVQMEECSQKFGPPMKCVFPVCNYHEETETNPKKDVLILLALKAMAALGKDHVDTNWITCEKRQPAKAWLGPSSTLRSKVYLNHVSIMTNNVMDEQYNQLFFTDHLALSEL